jgi:site-specific DNA recombinase
MKVALYLRVSTDDQDVEMQEYVNRKFVESRGHTIDAVFTDNGVSGKIAERKGLNELKDWVLKQKALGGEFGATFYDVSRLAREPLVFYTIENFITGAGGQMLYANFDMDSKDPMYHTLIALKVGSAKSERLTILQRTHNGAVAKLAKGYWQFRPPVGYKFDKRIMVPDEPNFSLYRDLLVRISTGQMVNLQYEWKKMKALGMKSAYSKFTKHITNEIYSGYYSYPNWGIATVKGEHQAMITQEQHLLIKSYLARRILTPVHHDKAYLCQICVCHRCGCKLGCGWSKSKTGNRYLYYFCNHNGCPDKRKANMPIAELDSLVFRHLNQHQLILKHRKTVYNSLLETVRDRLVQNEEQEYVVKDRIRIINSEIELATNRLIKTTSEITASKIEHRIDELQKQKEEALLRVANINLLNSVEIQKPFDYFVHLIQYLPTVWSSMPGKDKVDTYSLFMSEPLKVDTQKHTLLNPQNPPLLQGILGVLDVSNTVGSTTGN